MVIVNIGTKLQHYLLDSSVLISWLCSTTDVPHKLWPVILNEAWYALLYLDSFTPCTKSSFLMVVVSFKSWAA